MRELNFDGPINNLSLGNVSFNFLREIRKKDLDLNIFPTNNQANFSAFDKTPQEFIKWIETASSNRLKKLNGNIPTLRVWHINGSERALPNQYLYTFYETDSPTEEEVNIVNLQKHTFFSSSESADLFKEKGCEKVSHVPLGFDEDFFETKKEYLGKDIVHFGLIGKFERRKNTQSIIQLWANCYGNNPKYQLSCLVTNPFFSEDQMKQVLADTLQGKNITNINFISHLKTNSEVNDLMNSIDIDLSGISNGEGWNLPAFNCTALGKWSIVSNCSSHKDWATKENSILVEPEGKQPCYDNFFFKEGMPFNQGSFYRLSANSIQSAFKQAEKKVGQKNAEGAKLRDKFTYSKTIETILDCIYSDC